MTKHAIEQLARPDIVNLKAYVPAKRRDGLKRLNANEAPWKSSADHTERGLNHYPEARPGDLTELLAAHYGVRAEQLFVTRGTSEAIDLLIRCFCRPGIDEIVICPPTFGMYQVYADIQSAAIHRIPLDAARDYALPVDQIIEHWHGTSRLVFVTTPNNPTGHALNVDDIERLASALAGRGIVVVDSAYIEFGDPARIMALLDQPNVVVLRTLSKAYGLAGARCGSLIADPMLIGLIEKVMPPYAIPTPSAESALTALATESISVMPQRIAALVAERQRMHEGLSTLAAVTKVWPSDANFLLVAFKDPAAALQAAQNAGYLVRDFSRDPATLNCLRITIGDSEDNKTLLAAFATLS